MGEIDVTDTGQGIDKENLEKIFEYNFSESSSSSGGKLGFGLWWIKTFLARLGGSITAKSDGKSGTTFTIKLPQEVNYRDLDVMG